MRSRLEVAVVGAGTAGSAAAIFLARSGHRVTVFEQVPDPRAIGAGIVLQPSGMEVLHALGLLEEVVSRGAVLNRLHCETPERKPVVVLDYSDVAEDLYGVGLHRGVLFKALFDTVKAEPGIQLVLGVDVGRYERLRNERMRLFEDRTGRPLGDFDLLVVCDGARSTLRDGSPVLSSVEKYPWGALWFVGDDPDERFHSRLYQVVEGTERLMGLLPTGLGPEGDVPKVSLFWSIPRTAHAEWKAAGLGPWKKEVLRYAPEADALLDQIHSVDDVLFSEYHDVVMWPWHGAGVVFLGDCAHATSPQLGQGCNLALVDALTLARCLHHHDVIEHGLDAYSRERKAHLGYYQFATRWLTPFFQSDLRCLGPLRDYGLRLSLMLPWVRRQMVEAMCGHSLGPLAKPRELRTRPPPQKKLSGR